MFIFAEVGGAVRDKLLGVDSKDVDFDCYTWDELNTEFAAEMLMKVSVERIREELEKMFLFDTLGSMKLIQDLEESVQKAIFRDGLRLMPTLKQ